ncbi:D-alanyl-D-alanine carboxypeptidase/D-alanyl-D-alanine-endopeptidase [Porphyromonas pogonae]|uniref:D-alanyl-D-alanine carboxypeptidase/D-alanyl-D-alanine endopeptidase n=1 Tax=Porphyromonas pogonae TaxID=867595 RepID=UPI002E766794|nr:D-alanyl-D-alanine carboxypeptidase/D-alanyl-D-alanine-endopeptidase [Porphyromonas pogonae]
MNFLHRLIIGLGTASISIMGVSAQNPAALNYIKNAESREHAQTGLIVRACATGKTLLEYNSNQRMCPASLTKIMTTGAILRLKGPDFHFSTRIFTTGPIQMGTLHGDIIVYGGGDPALESHYTPLDRGRFKRELIAAIEHAGIKEITGDIWVDASRYGDEGVNPTWMVEDIGNYYGTGTYGFNIFDNRINLTLNSVGKVPQVLKANPEHPEMKWINKTTIGRDSVWCMMIPFLNQGIIYGSIPPKQKYYTLKTALPDPATYGAVNIKTWLGQAGVKVDGKGLGAYEPLKTNQGSLVMEYNSLPLDTLLKVTNFRSVNSFAEAMMKEVETANQPIYGQNIIRPYKIEDYWKATLGIQQEEMTLYDGCGLSPKNRITPDVLSRTLLSLMHDANPQDNVFLHSLPRAGKEGSVRSILSDGAVEAYLKSGSMSGVLGYGGYVQNKGNWYVVVFISNDHNSAYVMKHAFDQFVKSYFA